MSLQPKTKRCPPKSGCGDYLPATPKYFYRDSTITSGLGLYCKTCKNARTKDYNRRHPAGTRHLYAFLMNVRTPRYHHLIRMTLEAAAKKFKDPEASAKWLGMKTGTFEILLMKYLPMDIEEKCVHDMIKGTCSFCKG